MDATGRLTWRCRRGMKELDLLLMRYLRERWPDAQVDERQAFERLLDLPDPVLADYLFGRETPEDAAIGRVVGMLRPEPRRAPDSRS